MWRGCEMKELLNPDQTVGELFEKLKAMNAGCLQLVVGSKDAGPEAAIVLLRGVDTPALLEALDDKQRELENED